MLKLLFTYNHNIIVFEIHNKNIKYYDEKWKMGINFIPKDEGFVRQVVMSRNKIAPVMIKWINEANSGKDYEEWLACKDDYAVAEVVKKDAKMKGCVFREMYNEEQIKQQELDKQNKQQIEPVQEEILEEQQNESTN